MPYKIVKNDPRCDEGEYALVKEDDNKLMGCHASKEKAMNQMKAIYAKESK